MVVGVLSSNLGESCFFKMANKWYGVLNPYFMANDQNYDGNYMVLTQEAILEEDG